MGPACSRCIVYCLDKWVSPWAELGTGSADGQVTVHEVEQNAEPVWTVSGLLRSVRSWVMEDKWTIDKLDGSNWITWKFQLKHLLLAKGLWKYVDGSAVLAEDATAEQQAKYQSESQKAFSVIAMSVSTSQLYLITSCEEPRKAWDALKNFKRNSG